MTSYEDIACLPEKLETKTAETVLVLRTCQADGTSSHGFKWPESGTVKAYDWKPTKECGNGLHGWLWGHGDWGLKVEGDSIKWLVLEVAKDYIIDLSGKVKFPEANVIATFQNWWDAMKFIRSRHEDDEQTTIATGYSGHASATGNYGHASATANSGHASATGDSGHASATTSISCSCERATAVTLFLFAKAMKDLSSILARRTKARGQRSVM